eukprot:gene4521-8978_t
MAELGDFLRSSDDADSDVSVEMLDYEFVNGCQDVTKLKAVLRMLESGKEGHYPHSDQNLRLKLIKTVEDKIMTLLPDKERLKVLRLKKEVSPQDIQNAENDLGEWQKSIVEKDSKLKTTAKADKPDQIFDDAVPSNRSCPPPRGSKKTNTDHSFSSTSKTSKPSGKSSTIGTPATTTTTEKSKSERISGYNFRAWEKFDVDGAIADIDEEEHRQSSQLEEIRLKAQETARLAKERREQRYQQEIQTLRGKMSTDGLSAVEKESRSDRERLKGNEAYRIGENEEAYACYSRSLAYSDKSAIAYANRAMVSLRLENFQSAEDDCNRSLSIDPLYIKAWSRRGSARLRQGNYAGAIEDFAEAVRLDPGKEELIALLTKARSLYLDVEGHNYADRDSHRDRNHRGNVNNVSSRSLSASQTDDCTFVTVSPVSSVTDLLLPSTNTPMVLTGVCERMQIQNEDVDVDVETVKVEGSEFRRIQIEDEDEEEDEDDEDNNNNNNNNNNETVLTQASSISTTDTFVRIPIIDDDEEEETETGNEEEEAEGGGAFTRVQIQDEDSEEEEEVTVDPVVEAGDLKTRGNELMRDGETEAAVAAYDRCLELDPRHWPALSNRALAFLTLKRFKEAERDCTSLLTTKETHGLQNKALFRRAQALVGQGPSLIVLAIADLEDLLRIDPGNTQALSLKEDLIAKLTVQAKTKSTGDAKESDPKIARTDVISSWDVETSKRRAMSLLEDGKPAQAAETLKQALSSLQGQGQSMSMSVDKLPLLHLLASAESAQGNHTAARDACSTVLATDPRNVRALVRRANAAVSLGDTASAKKDALEALRIDPSSAEAMSIVDLLSQEETKTLSPPQKIPPKTTVVTPAATTAKVPATVTATVTATATVTTSSKETSTQLKDQGNVALKAQNYTLAVELYSQALTQDPSNMAAQSNRALAYLKLKLYREAERDASKVLEGDLSSDTGLRVKALYRRAQALYGYGGETDLQAALADLDLLIALEPSNKEAQSEMKKIENKIESLKRKSPVTPSATVNKNTNKPKEKPSQPQQPLSADGQGLGLAERSTTRRKTALSSAVSTETGAEADLPPTPPEQSKARAVIEEVSSSKIKGITVKETVIPSPSPVPNKPQRQEETTSPISGTTVTATATAATTTSVPLVSPKTAYEMERVWRGIRSRPELVAQYVKTFKKSAYSKVFTDTVTPDLLSSILTSLRDCMVDKDPVTVLSFLEGFSKIPKFNMTLTLLPERDITCVKSIFNSLEKTSTEFEPTRVENLRKKYNI